MTNKVLALKIDVDTERGTRVGTQLLLDLFAKLEIPATFLFSLGPDNTGRALKRIFRPGFLKKVSRTSVVSTYGVRTLLNGVLWPGPHIAKRHANIMRATHEAGHEVGIHSYDHCFWQDNLFKLSHERVQQEFQKALDEFKKVFGFDAKTAGTAGWQANADSLSAYDNANLLYGSDCRGETPFYPRVGDKTFKVPQFPSTLPTLDELIGRPEFPMKKITEHLISQMSDEQPNIYTMHSELEGTVYIEWFEQFLKACQAKGIIIKRMDDIAKDYLANNTLPVCKFIQGEMDGRSGTLAMQG